VKGPIEYAMKSKTTLLPVVTIGSLIFSTAPQSEAVPVRFIQIVMNDERRTDLHLAEVEAFEAGVTPNEINFASGGTGLTEGGTFDGLTTSTNDFGDGTLTTYGDGAVFPEIGTTTGVFHGARNKDPNNFIESGEPVWTTFANLRENAQYTLDLGEEVDITTIRLWPRGDMCCSIRWRDLEINLYGDDGGTPGSLNATRSYPEESFNALEFKFEEKAYYQNLIGQWTFEEDEELVDRKGNFPDLVLEGDAKVQDGQLVASGSGTDATGWAVTNSNAGEYQGPDITDKTLVSWNVLDSLEDGAKAGSAITIDRVSGDHFDGIIFAARQPNRWMNGSSGFQRTQDFDPGSEEKETGKLINLAITYEHINDGMMKVTAYRNGEVIGEYETPNASNWDTGDAEIFFGVRHGNTGGGPGALNARIEEARLYDVALNADEIKRLARGELMVAEKDRDNDGLRDSWELLHFGNLDQPADGDPDDDASANAQELERGTDPDKADTDEDGLKDGVETGTGQFVDANDTGSDPNKADSDNDGLKDGVETGTGTFIGAGNTGTDPNEGDSDGDRFLDGAEIGAPLTNPHDRNDPPLPSNDPFLVGQWTFEPGEETIDIRRNFPKLLLKGDAVVNDGKLDLNGLGTVSSGWAVTNRATDEKRYTGPDIGSKTLVSWVILQSLDNEARAGAAISVDRILIDGGLSEGIYFAQFDPNQWEVSGNASFSLGRESEAEPFVSGESLEPFVPGFEESEATVGTLIKVAVTFEHLEDGRNRITGYREAVEAGEKIQKIGQFVKDKSTIFRPGGTDIFFGTRHHYGRNGPTLPGPGAVDALIEEARIYNRALSEPEIEALVPGEQIGIFQITEVVVNKAENTLTVSWNSRKKKKYTVETSEDFRIWDEVIDGFPDDGATGSTTTFTIDEDIPDGATELYVRVREE
jgi:hypothetical protein